MNSYDFLKFMTVKLSAEKLADKNNCICTATGFYAIINNTPVIITAKHFVENTNNLVTIPAHYNENDTIVTIPIKACVDWSVSDEYDIAYCKVKPFEKKFKEITCKTMYYTALSEKDIISKEEFSRITILSEVLTIGYPAGLSSTHHEFPLFHKGYIASSPSDFAQDNEGYLSVCAYEGMSGSPIFLNNSRLKLVGVLVQYIKVENSKYSNTSVYVSADKIMDINIK